MQFKRTLLIASLALTTTAGFASVASAETRWQRDHPRQHQVLDRVATQRADVRAQYREGDLSRRGEAHLLRADTRVTREDHRMARINGGYVTKGQQRHMDRQLSGIHRHIPA